MTVARRVRQADMIKVNAREQRLRHIARSHGLTLHKATDPFWDAEYNKMVHYWVKSDNDDLVGIYDSLEATEQAFAQAQ
jgi:hypothetical protein